MKITFIINQDLRKVHKDVTSYVNFILGFIARGLRTISTDNSSLLYTTSYTTECLKIAISNHSILLSCNTDSRIYGRYICSVYETIKANNKGKRYINLPIKKVERVL